MGQGDPLQLQPDPEPQTEQVRLGDTTLNLDPSDAAAVRGAFETLAAQYGAQLEELRRHALQSIGGPPYQAVPPVSAVPDGLSVPDPDLLFQNKAQWTDQFASALQQQIGTVRGEAAQLVQGAVNAFQQELNRRDAYQQARATHDSSMEEMLERRGLDDQRTLVQAIYDQQFAKLQHLPLEFALDKIGELTQQEIERIRAGEKWTMTPGSAPQGLTQRPPAMLRSARRASPRPAAAAPSAPSEQQLEEPGGGLGMMGKIIRRRQAALMGGSA